MADVVGLCMMCGRPGVMYSCHLCGRLVCDQCYDRRHMICAECQHQKRHTNAPSYPMD